MARAVNAGSATTTVTNQLSGSARRIWVRCDTGSAAPINVRVQNSQGEDIHGDAEYRILAAGEEQVYDASVENPIRSVEIYTDSGTGTFSMEVTGA